ncbi:MAG TPA: helix-turn-helix domain-containing protein, partial [Longimicrobiales bacterium]
MIRYLEHAPSPALAPYVECFWTSRSDASGELSGQHVLPDACVDVVFDFSESVVSAPRHDLRSYVVGAMTGALSVQATSRVDMLGVRFRPGGAAAFLHLPLGEVRDDVLDVSSLSGGWEAAARRLHAAEPHERIPLLEAALAIRLRSAATAERLVGEAWSRLSASAGALPVERLATELGVGRRRLERLFHERFGLTPKEAARVARFRDVLARMRRHPEHPLGRLALDAGYYDQPHFNREFLRCAGVTPEAW